jgi:hypothetical protein
MPRLAALSRHRARRRVLDRRRGDDRIRQEEAMSAQAGAIIPPDPDLATIGPLEHRALTVMEAPLADTAAASGYAASNQGWWLELPPAERDQLTLLTFAGLSDAIRLLARHLDRTAGGPA